MFMSLTPLPSPPDSVPPVRAGISTVRTLRNPALTGGAKVLTGGAEVRASWNFRPGPLGRVGRFAAVLFVASAANAVPDLDQILRGVETRYNSAKTIQVDFIQAYAGRARNTTEKGTLFLSRPGRMRWQYSSPPGKLWISDGKDVYSYFPEQKRVEKSKFKETDDLRAPFAFLLGKLDFHEQFSKFDMTINGSDTKIVAFPKSDKLLYTEISFEVAPDFTIKRLLVKGQDGSATDYIFDNEKKNVLFSDAMFRFAPPAGVEVRDLDKVN
jgi:outer membrane lipoprotein carrier protein